MTEFRHLDKTIAAGIQPPADLGPNPVLAWLPLDELVIDASYQREIRKDGQQRVRRIVAAYSWTKFTPVIVSRLGQDGWYCIVDGQHRATAAAAAGVTHIPCQIIEVDTAGAAAAFAAINGEVTRVHSLERFHARIRAGDADAILVRDACAVANVELCRYPIAADVMKAGQTVALVALEKCYSIYGRDTLITALQCITETDNNVPGSLRGPIIRALCLTMDKSPEWREAGEALLRAFDDIDVLDLYEMASNSRQAATTDELVRLLKLALMRALGPPIKIGQSG